MAQQTINIGASPNDGTGTPLRTAFQYTNSNFSELYTATGPSGNNIVVPGSATITGDLTVDTNTLKVDSANNRVGIGTASPATRFVVSGGRTGLFSGDAFSLALGQTTGQANYLYLGTDASGTLLVSESSGNSVMTLSQSGVCTWLDGAGGTRMTLNSTGLGIGLAPVGGVKLSVAGTIYANAGNALILDNPSSNFVAQIKNTGSSLQSTLAFLTGSGTSMLIDNSGNVGIGVTPSAKLDVSANDGTMAIFRSSGGSSNDKRLTISSGGAKVVFNISDNSNTAIARAYEFQTAGSAAMTLDASGNLLVGTTSASTTSGSGFKVTQPAAGHFDASIVTSANSSIYSCWDIYSTGGTAGYRFYVTSNGTINAVNTTISAISDARLKENVQDIDVGLGAILALKPRKFDWKEGKGKNIKGDRGFIAQEFEQVFPQLVDEWKDAAPEGEAPYKSVRQDLIPVLVKAIQELTARVQTLETR